MEKRMRALLVGTLVVAAACAGDKPAKQPAAPVARTITAAGLDSLPRLNPTPGRLVCLADNVSPCPTANATGNWLRDGNFATWEPHKLVEMWRPSVTDPTFLGEVGNAENQYDGVLSAAATRTGFMVI